MRDKLSKILVLAAAVFLVQYVYPGVLQGAIALAGVEVVVGE
ncbi:MAG: hypothetical protein WC866_01735 [Patescibacteria group bacterium]|jgi:hypothetical protein